MNNIKIDLDRQSGTIHPNMLSSFAEHPDCCFYIGIHEPGSPLANEHGFRKDILEALSRLNMPIIRYLV